MVCFLCLCSAEKYKKCDPLVSCSNTKAVDPLINLDSKTSPALHFAFLFDLTISLFLVEKIKSFVFRYAGKSPDFKAGVMALSSMLKIQRHDDYLVMLKVGVQSYTPCV